jgi:hypothetical protein
MNVVDQTPGGLPPGFVVDPQPTLPPGFKVDQGEPDSKLSRFATGLMDPVIGAAQIAEKTGAPRLLRKALSHVAPSIWVPESDTSMEDVVRERDKNYKAPEGVDWMRMAGNVANPVNYAAPGASAARLGALSGVLTPTQADDDLTTFAAKKLGQAGLGAVAGRVLGGKSTPEGKALTEQGVHLTPGQATGPASVLNDVEQKLTSLPFTGKVIEQGRRKAAEDVQGLVTQRATGIPGLTDVRKANTAVGSLFDQSVPHLKPNIEGFDGAVNALAAALKNPELTAENQKVLTGIVNKHFDNYASLSGEGLKKLDSQLGYLARSYSGRTASPQDKVLAEEITNVMMGLRQGLEQGVTPEVASMLRQANRGYRGMIPINKAASARVDELATPRALQKALAQQAKTDVTRMAPDSLLDPAVSALSKGIVPDSGTAGRSPGLFKTLVGAAGYLPAKAIYSPWGKALLTHTGTGKTATSQAILAALRGYGNQPEEDQNAP